LIAALLAAPKNAGALQYETLSEDVAWQAVHAIGVLQSVVVLFLGERQLVPLKPIQRATIALAGRFGTTGAAAGFVPLSMTSG